MFIGSENLRKGGGVSFPTPTNSDPKLLEAWQDWIAYRKEIKEPLGPVAAKLHLRKLEEWGQDKFILAIETSINRNWMGLFEPQMAPVSKPAAPLWQQIKNLEQEIANHKANHASLAYDPDCSEAEKLNLANKRDLLFKLKSQQNP